MRRCRRAGAYDEERRASEARHGRCRPLWVAGLAALDDAVDEADEALEHVVVQLEAALHDPAAAGARRGGAGAALLRHASGRGKERERAREAVGTPREPWVELWVEIST